MYNSGVSLLTDVGGGGGKEGREVLNVVGLLGARQKIIGIPKYVEWCRKENAA